MKEEKVYNTKEGYPIPPDHIPSVDEMQRLADGDKSVVPILVEGLIGFATGILDNYIDKLEPAKPYREDLTSEAMLTLCTFVQGKLGDSIESTRFMNMLAGAVKNNTNDWLRESTNTITIPSRQQRRSDTEFIRHPLKENHSLSIAGYLLQQIDVEEFLDGLSTIQEQVLRMKMDDATDYRIAEELGLHRGVVTNTLEEIKTLYGER